MRFVMKLYEKQVRAGRVFVHENPTRAKSWALPEIRKMMLNTGVDVFEADQCMYGMKTWGESRAQLVLAMKPTKFMTNSQTIGRELIRKCDGSHEHQPLVDGRACASARYPAALCKALCRGIIKEKLQRSLDVRAVVEIQEGEHWRSLDLD